MVHICTHTLGVTGSILARDRYYVVWVYVEVSRKAVGLLS